MTDWLVSSGSVTAPTRISRITFYAVKQSISQSFFFVLYYSSRLSGPSVFFDEFINCFLLFLLFYLKQRRVGTTTTTTALGQVMLYVDGMNGVMEHNPTVQWLYSLIASKYRLVAKTALKLLLVFVEYVESNCQLLVKAVETVDSSQGTLHYIHDVTGKKKNNYPSTCATASQFRNCTSLLRNGFFSQVLINLFAFLEH